MRLITVREYAKQEGLTEQGVRKRVTSKLIKSVQLDELTYIVIDDNRPGVIKDLKSKIKLLNSNIKTLKAQAQVVINQDEHIKKLENRVEYLEQKLDDLFTKLEESTSKKEELYEKVISTVLIENRS